MAMATTCWNSVNRATLVTLTTIAPQSLLKCQLLPQLPRSPRFTGHRRMCLSSSSSQLPPPLLFLHSALLWPPRCRLTFDYDDGISDVTVPSKRDTDDDDKVQQQKQCQQFSGHRLLQFQQQQQQLNGSRFTRPFRAYTTSWLLSSSCSDEHRSSCISRMAFLLSLFPLWSIDYHHYDCSSRFFSCDSFFHLLFVRPRELLCFFTAAATDKTSAV